MTRRCLLQITHAPAGAARHGTTTTASLPPPRSRSFSSTPEQRQREAEGVSACAYVADRHGRWGGGAGQQVPYDLRLLWQQRWPPQGVRRRRPRARPRAGERAHAGRVQYRASPRPPCASAGWPATATVVLLEPFESFLALVADRRVLSCPCLLPLAVNRNVQVRRGVNLVYGGGSIGLMGVIARTVDDGGCRVLGYVPAGCRACLQFHSTFFSVRPSPAPFLNTLRVPVCFWSVRSFAG